MRMKTKVYALLIAALVACNVCVANATRLYLIGTATDAGWSLDQMDMMVEENGTYTWVGDLKEGSLKLMLTNMYFGDSYGPAANGDALATAGLAKNMNGTDNQFAVSAGRYSLTVTLGDNPTITVADGTGLADKRIAAADVYPEALYAIGNATEAGWNTGDAIEMTETEYGKYAGELTLKAGENLEMKFLAQKDWGKQFGPQTDGEAVNGAGSYSLVKAASGDPKYHTTMAEDTHFAVSLDLAAATMTLTATAMPKLTTMWIIGEPVGGYNFDDNAKAMTLDATQDSVWTWTGDLAVGEMKFCGKWWEFTANAFGADADATADMAEGSNGVKPIVSVDVDNKFRVTRAGNYSLTLNLRAMTLNAVLNYATALSEAEQAMQPAKVLRGGKVLILRAGQTYDLLGNIVY